MRKIKRAVVSGATSFLGSAVVRELLDNECEVYGIVRPESKSKHLLPQNDSFYEIPFDIAETDKWIGAIKHADTFFHFAWGGPGISGRSDAVIQGLSAENTFKAIDAAAQMGVTRFFISGSQAEYGKTNGRITEETPCNPILEYGKNKLRVCQQAPMIVKEHGMEYVHARFFSVYGPNDHPYTLIPSCIRAFLNNKVMEMTECSNKWNFLHVDDAARASVLLAECDLAEPSVVVNLAGEDTRILREFVEEIYCLCGKKGKCEFGARHTTEEPVDNWPDIARLKGMIDWLPEVTFREGVLKLIQEEMSRMGR